MIAFHGDCHQNRRSVHPLLSVAIEIEPFFFCTVFSLGMTVCALVHMHMECSEIILKVVRQLYCYCYYDTNALNILLCITLDHYAVQCECHYHTIFPLARVLNHLLVRYLPYSFEHLCYWTSVSINKERYIRKLIQIVHKHSSQGL